MARIQKRVIVVCPINVGTTIVTAAAGRKLEILTLGVANFSAAAAQLVFYEIFAAGNWFVAQQAIVAARFAETVNFTSLLIPSGSSFAVLPLGAGAPVIAVHCTYMEVG